MTQQRLDFQVMWEGEMKRFEELTGRKLLSSFSKSPESLQEEFDNLFDDEEQETGRKAQAKRIGMNIISCVKLLGGVAAMGASTVFPPADLCFNALSLLLDVPKQVSDLNEEIQAVFAEIGPTLSQFKIYERIERFYSIDEGLLMSVHEVLICFVDVCALCINFQHGGKWKRFKARTKRVLFDDKEIADGLKRFEGLVQQQQNTQNTVALEYILRSEKNIVELLNKACETNGRVKNIESNVGILTDAEKKRSSEKMAREYVSRIKAKLGISEEEQNASKTAYEEIWKSTHPGSGNWFKDIDCYVDWAESVHGGPSPLLFLIGPPGSGKTFSVSAIIHHLQSKYNSTESANKCLVAYHFFPARTGKNGDDKQPIETALKSLALQLAEQDSAHAKIVATACSDATKDEKFFKNAKCLDLWNTLKLGTPMRKTTHFIAFDGLNRLTPKEVDMLLEMIGTLQDTLLPENDSGSVKILVCGQLNNFESGFIKLDRLPPSTIEIMDHIKEEMRMYLDRELQAAELFQGRDPKTLQLKKEIHKMLLGQPDCNFYTIQEALSDIKELVSSGGSEAELIKLLAKFSLDPVERLKEDISKLETELMGRQVDEVNELLGWVLFGQRYLLVEELEAALFLRFKRDIIERLDKYIEKKFSKILRIGSDSRVRVQDEDIADCVVKQRETPRVTDDPPRISATITITNVNRTTIQRFLWDLNAYSTLDHFSFQQGSENSNSPKGHIQVNEVDSHLNIVKLTLEFLRGPVDPRTRAIGNYLLSYLPHHLEVLLGATGLDVIGPNDKRDIGRGVYDLFDDAEIVERHWDSCAGVNWVADLRQMTFFWKWLQDPVAISSLSRNDKKLLDSARSHRNPQRKLLAPMMTKVAHIWLQTRTGKAYFPFRWIRGFLSLTTLKAVENGDQKDNEASSNTDAEELVEIALIEDDVTAVSIAEKWARLVLASSEKDTLWYERLGDTYMDLRAYPAAAANFREAIKMPDPNWTAFQGLAECLCEQNDLLEACSQMRKAEEMLVQLGDAEKPALLDVRMRLAKWYTSLQRPDDALSCCEAAYELSPDNTRVRCIVMRQYFKHGREQEAQKILAEAASASPSSLGDLLEFIVDEEEEEEPYPSFFWKIVRSCRAVGCLDVLIRDLETAISETKADGDYFYMSVFLLYKGVALQHLGKTDATAARLAPSFWEQCCLVARENLTWRYDRVRVHGRASRVLSAHHFEKLREGAGGKEGKGRDKNERHLAELERLVAEQYQINPGLSAAKSFLGAYYTAVERDRARARKVFLSDMGTAFRMLSDAESINDWEGFAMLLDIMIYSGDEPNARAAGWQLAPAVVNADILEALLRSEGLASVGETAIAEVLRVFGAECRPDDNPQKAMGILMEGVRKLALMAADDEHENEREQGQEQQQEQEHERPLKDQYNTALALLEPYDLLVKQDFQYTCDECEAQRWGFEEELYPCRFCHNTGFCRPCLERLRASDPDLWHVCSPTHDWLRLPRWDVRRYVLACRRIVELAVPDGDGEKVVTMTLAEWLVRLRDDWGLSSEDWPDSIFVQPLARSSQE